MKLLTHPGVLIGLLSVQVNVDWPRLIVALLVLGGLLGYMVYSWVKR
ncbi:MAG TPA: hypothetical protein VME18_05765 [Acidobacteriaceae bacterium]|jgi:hypothetical protein|nr:hypothetical protein [Acidobacteriaceae bacterium]